MKPPNRVNIVKRTGTILGVAVLVLLGFAAGRLSMAPPSVNTIGSQLAKMPVLQTVQDRQGPGDARELIPLPGPGQGEGQGQQPPAECPLYLYQDGELYSLEPGPGNGPLPGPGRGGPQELIPLEPDPPAPAPQRPPEPENDSRDFV